MTDEVVNGYYYLGSTFKPTNYTYHHDPLQFVVGISAPTGGVTETLSYGPFGNLLASSGTSSSTLRYTGREHDSLSGLYYYRARYYDPEIGRFLSEDPLGFDAGVNFYAYVNNNPLIANDPTGLIDFVFGAGGSAVVPTGGAEASGGVFVGVDNQTGAPRGGPFVSVGAGAGYNISYDVFLGIAEDINGPSINQNYGLGPFSLTTFHDPVSGRVIGGTFGVGGGVSQLGYSATYATTVGFDVVEPIVRATDSIRRVYAKP